MLTREKDGTITFTCDADKCNEFLETDTTSFEAARGILRGQDWRTSKDGDEWLHTCPICLSEEYEKTL